MGIRLCLLFPHLRLGGGETAMLDLAAGLRREFDLGVAAFDLDRSPEAGPTIRGELCRRFGDVTFLAERWHLRALLARVDVLLWYGVVPQVARALLAAGRRPASIRVIHTDREIDGAAFQRRWARAVDAVVCVAPAVARAIPGAVFIPNTCSDEHLRGAARVFFPAHPRRKTLGFLGRLVPFKNAAWLVENVERLGCNLLLQALDTELLTAAELERLAAARGLASRVRFLPPGRDVGTLLRSVDALVIASRHEGLPRVAIEAGFTGVPVISTRVGALPELFPREILFVDTDGGVPRLDSLRAAVERVEPAWGERLRRRVARLCDREEVVARYAELIRRLVAPTRRGRGGGGVSRCARTCARNPIR